MKILGVHKGAVEVLIAVNVIVYVLEWAEEARWWLYRNFALQAVNVFVKPWSLVTSMFIHNWDGFHNHILFNMIALFFFGLYLERLIGEKKFLKVYFLGGFFASACYVATSLLLGIPHVKTMSMGASGAIFAVMGTLLVLRPNMKVLLYFFIPMPLYLLAIFYIIYSVPAMFSGVGNIAHNAHLGGLLAGYLFGKHYKSTVPREGVRTHGYRFY